MKEKEWFEEWFDSPYYHVLYRHRGEEEAQKFINRIVLKLKIQKGAKILDVACGKGRHSRTLAQLGFDVTGIDLSPNSIEYARQFENESLKFDVWDMRKAYKKSEFDYVVNLFSSFGYFDEEKDDYATIRAFADNLKPGGILLIDYINTEYAVKAMKNREIIQRGEIQFHIKKKIESGFIKKEIDFLVDGEDYHYEEQLKIINRFNFEKMLGEAGFELKNIFGDYQLNVFDAATSPRLILMAAL